MTEDPNQERKEVTEMMRGGMTYYDAMSKYQKEHHEDKEVIQETEPKEKKTKESKVSPEEPTEQEVLEYYNPKEARGVSSLSREEYNILSSPDFLKLPEEEREEILYKVKHPGLFELKEKTENIKILSKLRYPREIKEFEEKSKEKVRLAQIQKHLDAEETRRIEASKINTEKVLMKKFGITPLPFISKRQRPTQPRVGLQRPPRMQKIPIKPKKQVQMPQVKVIREVQRPSITQYYNPVNDPRASIAIFGQQIPLKGKKTTKSDPTGAAKYW